MKRAEKIDNNTVKLGALVEDIDCGESGNSSNSENIPNLADEDDD